MIRLILILATLVAVETRAEVPSIVSHYYVGTPDSRDHVSREKAVASMYVIRPVGITANPIRFMSDRWEANRNEAARLRGVFREGVEREYRAYGLQGELTAEQKDDLDTILKRGGSVIAICEPDHPEKILQIVSFAYDANDGLPMERHHKETVFKRGNPEWRFAKKRFIEASGDFYEIPLNSLILSLSPTYEGESAELKTFIRGKKSQQDWIPAILRTVVSMELLRHGNRSLPGNTAAEFTAFRDAHAVEIRARVRAERPYFLELTGGDPVRAAAIERGVLSRIFEQDVQRTVGIDEVRIQVHGDKLVKTYVETYGFHDTGLVIKHGDNPDEWFHVLTITREELENVAVDRLNDRKGVSLVRDNKIFLAENDAIPEQPCGYSFSQVGTKTAPLLGTRGAILGDPNFKLW